MNKSSEVAAGNVVSVGFVDTYDKGHFTGWTYTNQRSDQSVRLYVNSFYLKSIDADVLRPDVKEAGLLTDRCGFDFRIDLSSLSDDGCSIALHDPIFDKPLEKGLLYYRAGKLSPDNQKAEASAPLSIKGYISVMEATSANITPLALIELAMDILGHLPLSTFVAMSYLLVLGRTPDPEGFSDSLKINLKSQIHRRDFLLNMIGSAEFRNKRTISAATNDLKKLLC